MILRRFCLVLLPAAIAAAQGDDAAFVLLDGRTGKQAVENPARAARGFTPCSTFKIPNTLIALESLVASDPAFPLEYHPERDGEQSGAWSRDQDLRSALRLSTVWYYQELARRVGAERMQKYLDTFDYGNKDQSGGIDQFWLGRGLRISPEEQVVFLRRLNENQLGVSLSHTQAVRDMLLLETTPEYRWYGKTGTCSAADHGPVAWHVGFVERADRVSYYALNFTGATVSELVRKRPAMIRAKLASAGLVRPAAPAVGEQMESAIRSTIAAFPGVVGLYAKNLDTGATFGIREDERVRTASTIKLPILAATFSAVAQGKASWNDLTELREEDKIGGSGVLREFSAGLKFPLRDLVNLMIVVSDNTATNLVLDRITADYVNTEMDKFGLRQTRSLRKIIGKEASGHSKEGLLEEFRRFGIGVSTPREMVTLLEKIERGEVVGPEPSREMLAILERQQYKDAIGRQLPNARVASKSGSLDRLRSDVGIVRSIGGRIAIAVTVDDMLRTDYSAENAGSKLISNISLKLIEGLSAPVTDLGAPQKVVELKASMDHVQGIDVDGERLLVSWVDRKKKTGHLGEFELATGKLVRSIEIQQGERYHPGGIANEGDSVWVPVAEYRPNSSALIQRRNRRTLALESEFVVNDHIGCIAVMNGRVFGGNWDSRQIYSWDASGKPISKRDNPSGTSFQDMKSATGAIVGGGLRPDGGAIDWLDPRDLRLIRRVRTGKTNRGVLLTHEGMALSGDRLYLLPEDSPSRLFVFALPR